MTMPLERRLTVTPIPRCRPARDARAGRALSLALVAAALACLAPIAKAADTQWWIVDQASDLARAEARGVVIDPDGTMKLGAKAESWAADSMGVIWAAARMADGSIALAGDNGRIDRWTPETGVKRWVTLPVGQVLSLVADGTGLIAGTAPEGLIYRVSAKRDTSLLARTGERYVWGVAAGERGAWYAATGTHGRLFRIEGGKAKLVLDCDESNLVSLISDGHGGVYTGGDSHGHVIHVGADGAARTLFAATEDEVRALVLGADGALYAAALSASAMNTAGNAGVALTAASGGPASSADPDDDDRPQFTPPVMTGGRAVVYRIAPDSSVTIWWSAPQAVLYALAADGRSLLAGSGNRAGVYRVSGANEASVLASAPQGQITALISAGGAIYAAASNPGALWRLGPATADRGTLTSGTFDAHRMSRFGRLVWHGRGGKATFATRSGNTDSPDTTWSAWASAEVPPEGVALKLPPGRYAQWKLTLEKPDQAVSGVDVSWREFNQPPRIADVIVAPQGAAFREGDLQPRMEPVTQTLAGGQKVEYSMPSTTGPHGLRALPAWARGLRTVQWHASDPNGDLLRYRLERRAEGATDWTLMAEKVESTAFTWDTNPLPDGRYRVRVTVTDAASNAVGEEAVVMAESVPFDIDNTPPKVVALSASSADGGVAFEGEATDEGGRLAQLDVAIDEEDWRPVAGDGGLIDGPSATFHARLKSVAPGDHTLSIRATDLCGNSSTRAIRVTVPRAR
jgi:hypothetical protein